MEKSTVAERASELLEGMRVAFAADGYGLRVEPADAGVHVLVSADSDVCADCLVPADVFRGIVQTVFDKGGLEVERIDLTYPNDVGH